VRNAIEVETLYMHNVAAQLTPYRFILEIKKMFSSMISLGLEL
jgi:hypothetical protein